jgi:hypothetical protein
VLYYGWIPFIVFMAAVVDPSFKKLNWRAPNRYEGYTWRRMYPGYKSYRAM